MDSLVIEGCAVATVNGTAGGVITAAGTGAEHGPGHLVLQDGRITAVGAGPAPAVAGARVVDGGGCLATPGLIGTHHHLFQGLTRGLAQDSGLMRWLTALYPLWAGLDAELHGAAARAWPRSRCRAARPPPITITCSRAGAMTCWRRGSARRGRSACACMPAGVPWTSGRPRAGCRRTA